MEDSQALAGRRPQRAHEEREIMKLKPVKNKDQSEWPWIESEWAWWIEDEEREGTCGVSQRIVAAICRKGTDDKSPKALADLFAAAPETAAELERVKALVEIQTELLKESMDENSPYNILKALNAEMLKALKKLASCHNYDFLTDIIAKAEAHHIDRIIAKAETR